MLRITGARAVFAAFLLVACSGSRPPSKQESGAPPPSVAAASLPPPDPREAALARAVVDLLEEHHLRATPIDDALSRAAFERYIEALDPGKAFLLKADADELAVHAEQIDDQLRSGRLALAHAGAAKFAERLAVVEKLVADLLSRPFDHTDEEWVELDPEKLELAGSEEELRERWRQRLELEVLERVATMEERLAAKAKGDDVGAKDEAKAPAPGADPGTPGVPDVTESTDSSIPLDDIPETREGREAKARADLAARYAGRFARLARPDSLEAASELINAVTFVFDPHTSYLPPADEANFDIALSGSLEGIGAVLREHDHYIEVVEIVPGGASYRQGKLAPGDLILAVAQAGEKAVDVVDMRLDEVVSMVRGKKGTVVTLTIQKPTGEVSSLSITRDVVVIEDAYARGAVVERNGDARKYGYIHLPSFYGGRGAARSAAEDVRALLTEARDRKLTGVVLDLRSNGGGLLDDAVELTGLLIDRGPVVQTRLRDGDPEILRDRDAGTRYDGPVVVLVDRFTASASEIVAGALQDYGRAVVVGTAPTHGKGTVQVLADLDRASPQPLGDLKLTIQQYFRVTGSSVQWKGIVPDVLLPDPAGHLESGERNLDNSIPWSEIDAVEHAAWKATWPTADLAARSQARVGKDALLSRVAAASSLLAKRRDETRLPLARDAWEQQRTTRRAELEAASPDLDAAAARLSVTPLDPDGKKAAAAANGDAERQKRWKDNLAKDPWVDEAVAILGEMSGPAKKTAGK